MKRASDRCYPGIRAILTALVVTLGVGCGASSGKSGTPGSPATAQPESTAGNSDNVPKSQEILKIESLGEKIAPILIRTPNGAVVRRTPTNDDVRDLTLSGTKFTPADVDLLLAFPNLRQLDFTNVKPPLGDEGLRKLAPLKKLKTLRLIGQNITGSGLEVLKEFPELEILDVAGNPIGDGDLVHLEALPKLDWLVLEGCLGVTDQAIPFLKKMMVPKHLVLTRSGFSEAGVKELQAALTNCQVIFD